MCSSDLDPWNPEPGIGGVNEDGHHYFQPNYDGILTFQSYSVRFCWHHLNEASMIIFRSSFGSLIPQNATQCLHLAGRYFERQETQLLSGVYLAVAKSLVSESFGQVYHCNGKFYFVAAKSLVHAKIFHIF